ncbi:ribosomal protein L22 [Methanosalsum zhilinae DSM 4017]|uniref:Ribosomal protein L22 n=1 Tax=Methanosalsum zhilinae (strain DSM 4017 / NBRC 107636 / OCM 62 / WeN5) TaxID=679901 RepID=F7XM17_METZD|nr:ribosomal protein L22 [Methanosalsum zhilinae DSM 4017]
MQLFKSYTFTWWQIGIFKLALLAIGIAIGAYWNEIFSDYLIALIVIAVITNAYIIYVSLKQTDLDK